MIRNVPRAAFALCAAVSLSTPFICAESQAQVCDAAAAQVFDFQAKPAIPTPSQARNLALTRVPEAALPAIDIAPLLAEDEMCGGKCQRIGIPRTITLTPNQGRWIDVQDGRLWVSDLVIGGAFAVRVHFTNINLPDRAQLTVYRPDEQIGPVEIAGPFVDRGILGTGEFWTGEISGERVRIECFVPATKPGHEIDPASLFTIDQVQHIYRDPLGQDSLTPTNCTDVSCSASWINPSHAVARITYVNGGTFNCSGQLIFTQNSDYTPYFLTANHCISTNAVAQTTTFYWLYQTSTCNGTPPTLGNVPSSNVGTLLATGAASDFTLMMVEGALPCGLYWYGWDSNTQPNGTSGVCISHPGGTWKRIAFGTKQNAFGCGGANHIGMSYTGASGTEPGSSGAAFVIPAGGGRIIGQLHCGPSSCEVASNDDYGAFSSTYPNISSLLAGGSDDLAEDNDTCATALTIAAGNLNNRIVKSTDEDWYRVSVPSGQQLTVNLNFTHANGDVDLRLYGTCGGSILASSTSTSNSESVTFVNTGATQNFFIHVYLFGCDTRNSYNMSVAMALPAPPNNACANATSVGLGTYSFTTIGATTDGPNEPTLCSNANDTNVSNDVWYRYTSACTGITRVSLCDSNYDTKLAVYGSPCPGASAAIACNDDACGINGWRSEVTFNSVAGNQYLIRIGGYNGATGNGTMIISCYVSNSCATAVNIGNGSFAYTTVGATTDGPDEPSACNFFGYTQVGNDIWYRYTASCSGQAIASICNSNFDTKIAVYEGTCPSAASAIACNDDACGSDGFKSQVIFNTTVGFQYLIRIGGFNGATGSGVLQVECPYNNACEFAPLIGNGVHAFSNVGASTDGPNEPGACNFFGDTQVGSDIWYRYTASCSTAVTVKLCSSDYDSKVAVYSGPSCPVSASAIACNDDACGTGTQSKLTFNAVAGSTYRIRIGGFTGAQGSGSMIVTCCPADTNFDNVVNVSDLLTVISSWGVCNTPPQPCNSDINGDLSTNVADLLAIISGWGGCP